MLDFPSPLDGFRSPFGARRGAAFSPESLFMGGDTGAWFDPSDLSTMFQDTSGTLPITTTGQTVGLLLDKSKGLVLGSELVSNGGFDTVTTGWTGVGATLAVVSGQLELTATGGSTARSTQTVTTVVGKTYKATATMRRGTSAINCDILISGITQSAAVTVTSNTTVSVYFVAVATTTTIRPGTNGVTTAGQTAYVDNVSVKEVLGNHSQQATGAQEPAIRFPAAVYYLEDDLVDDNLNWTATAGTYDIAYVASNGTVTFLDDQALSGATDILLTQNLAGYIARNSAFSDTEKASITAYFGTLT